MAIFEHVSSPANCPVLLCLTSNIVPPSWRTPTATLILTYSSSSAAIKGMNDKTINGKESASLQEISSSDTAVKYVEDAKMR